MEDCFLSVMSELIVSISFSFILMAIVTIIIILTTYLFNKKNNTSIVKESQTKSINKKP
jgi:uncharacterized protein (UPF0333 family)